MCIITSAVTIGALSISAAAANAVLAAGAVATVTSTALGTVSSYTQGKQQQAMYNYQAQVAEENAKIANNNAAIERQTGIEEARMQRIKTLQAVGSQQTAMAANGMDVTQGTSLDIIEDTAAMGGAWQIENNPKGVGVCWMLSTDEIFNHKICLLRELKKEFVKYDEKFWFLYNIIYAKNSFAKGWLKRFGFKFDNPKPEGVHVPYGFEFFYRIRETRGLC